MKYKFILIICFSIWADWLSAQNIGSWSFSKNKLPVYQFTGAIPFRALDEYGNDALQPQDPYFLLGNYRMALITHASGIFQLLTAERAWARINGTVQTNYGWNEASVTFKGNEKMSLTGINSIGADSSVAKHFGVGFASYRYQLKRSLACTRILSVKPSVHINTGNPAFVITVILKNTGNTEQQFTYAERMVVNFVLNSTQYTAIESRPIRYQTQINIDKNKQTAIAQILAKANKFFVIPQKNERFMYDIHPPSVFMSCRNKESDYRSVVESNKDTIAASVHVLLRPGQTRTFYIVIGMVDHDGFNGVKKQLDDMLKDADTGSPLEGLYAKQWKKKLPDLSGEKSEILRREMLWNAHMMEASAKYSDYFKETFIPQGTVYSYYYGDNISNRDQLQAALPACYTNPQLAKSCIRYVMKHTDFDGEIKRGNSGYGYSPPSIFKESDEQLYFFNTIAEYLLITKDYGFLNEKIAYYPAEYGKKDRVLNLVKKYFIYLRDEVGKGPNGLVKMLNSDWSDSFFHKYSPNVYAGVAESHLNTTMVLAIFPKLIDALKQSKNPEAADLIKAMESYRIAIEHAFMLDFGDRKFAARAYLGNQLKFGLDNVCIEPQGYLLQIPTLAASRKKEIYEFVKSKLLTPEKIGIRTREKPLWGGNPDGEDGGIWYSLEYPVLLGVATFDKDEARSLLLKFSFQNFAEHYPEYWVGQWTAADEVNSTLYRQGLYAFWVPAPDKKTAFQGYCSHPHTWPLFCYFKLLEH